VGADNFEEAYTLFLQSGVFANDGQPCLAGFVAGQLAGY
jgi:hypothetical protein